MQSQNETKILIMSKNFKKKYGRREFICLTRNQVNGMASANLPAIILGAGGHAQVLADTLRSCSREIIGFTDQNLALANTRLLGIEILGGDELLARYKPDSILLVNGLGSVDSTQCRASIYSRMKKRGYRFATVVHPSAVIGREVVLAEGVQALAGVVIQTGTLIGENSIVNTNSSIDHHCHIGAHVHLAPGVVLSGGVTIGDCVHMGTGAIVIQGVTVGTGCLVGAGSVVLSDVESDSKVVGAPARRIRR
jgi:UDP-perosamine 4-acetyltransferase